MPDEYTFPLIIPGGHETGTIGGLWTPDGVEYIQSWLVGMGQTERVFKHEFKLNYKGAGEYFSVLAEESTSDAHIEDMAAKVAERSIGKIIERLQRRGSKLIPEQLAGKTYQRERRELAAIFRDFRKHQKRRRASTGGKIYYPGLVK